MSAFPLYAVIDLGSNSFHMLITRLVADSVQVVDKVKRKVRLASGLDENNKLDDEAIERGLECLSFFAERLQDIPTENIRIVATATLRIASNSAEFIAKANTILGKKITLLTGHQEAEYIYLGVAHTSCSNQQRLVLDIGGASTEIIVGDGFSAQKVESLNIGCVTYLKRYFHDGALHNANFERAIAAAKLAINPHLTSYKKFNWNVVLGGSGTMQALAEILLHQHLPSIISTEFLASIKAQLIACQQIENINIAGLQSDRTPVFASGVAILIALFDSFSVKQLLLSSGAIREGLLYEMLPDMRQRTIRERTIESLCERFHIDEAHATRVKATAVSLFSSWPLKQDNSFELLKVACSLHEVGLLLEYKRHQQHGAYIIQNADLPGFDQADKQLLCMFVRLYKADIDSRLIGDQSATSIEIASSLLAILRLAVILCRRRQDDVLPTYHCEITNNQISLTLPDAWLAIHPLISDELKQEHSHLQKIGLSLKVSTCTTLS